MTAIQAIILGAVQGLTEFLPISSSAHLILVPWFLGWQDQGLTFDVVLHAGTLVAILSYFWKDWYGMLRGLLNWRSKTLTKVDAAESRLFFYVVCGTIPAALAGFFAEKAVETTLRSPFVLSFTMIGVAVLLWVAEKTAKLKKGLSELTLPDAMSIGTAQALALIPGTSRSGITITAGLFLGFTRETAARFSFLLSAPIIAGAGLKKTLELRHEGFHNLQQFPLLLGFLASLIVGYLTIKFLMSFLQKNSLFIFVCYRILLGMVILFLIHFAGFRP
jgi:undecaprenyl-diphosphatase